MAIQDIIITLKGVSTQVAAITLLPQADGSTTLVVVGATQDAAGNGHALSEARLTFPPGVAVIDNIKARALTELRKANGLEV